MEFHARFVTEYCLIPVNFDLEDFLIGGQEGYRFVRLDLGLDLMVNVPTQ